MIDKKEKQKREGQDILFTLCVFQFKTLSINQTTTFNGRLTDDWQNMKNLGGSGLGLITT
jgi:hypothetical protein